MAYSYSSIKIPLINDEQFNKKIQSLCGITRIIRIESCLPEHTDTACWYNIYYEHAV